MRPKITFDPDPPQKGKALKICYTGTLPRTLDIDWDPAGTPTSATCPSPGGCVTITVPANASSVIVHDPSGAAEDKTSVVV
jgi:hypothetical protein